MVRRRSCALLAKLYSFVEKNITYSTEKYKPSSSGAYMLKYICVVQLPICLYLLWNYLVNIIEISISHNSWYPEIVNIFVDTESFKHLKDDQQDSFHNSVSTLISNQVSFFILPVLSYWSGKLDYFRTDTILLSIATK